ncbi:MAG: SDR family oxidoreductase [Bosea sp.]|uniref:SDR family NAD(P)-dependent oxidoreductase n=1 Tax=unclassified Bosea (in: a-proteobacteria) TaxID=2653178 RepID=UPI00095F962C|nr:MULTISPECIES: SDR family NAD(P)-dependent oxidoreductase [unclassified Bosea (in: a-proteobacteria)]MBN9458991.1 SDR family oxidoreductase [Bosea sp. (in: a-proteobacteria)]OJV06264.1 MAG: 3-oxoacyl-ACP reductase [Bosea sp. 67-29]
MTRQAIVTGASRGIGRAIAIGLAERGYDLALTDLATQKAALDETAAEIGNHGRRCVIALADVSDPADCRRSVAEAVQGLGHVDALVNNAGILKLASIEELTPELWDTTLAVNARGVFQMTQAMIPHMRERRYGRIVNIASLAARTGGPGQSHYAASKSAVVGFTRVASMELGQYGITVNAVCPGIIQTEMGMNNLRDPERVAYFEKVTDLHRLGNPEDVVGPVAFFASDDSAFVTGQALNVDGGIFYS